MKHKSEKSDAKTYQDEYRNNMFTGVNVFALVFGLAVGIDFLVKRLNCYAYIPGSANIIL